jgi:hypothetical protein
LVENATRRKACLSYVRPAEQADELFFAISTGHRLNDDNKSGRMYAMWSLISDEIGQKAHPMVSHCESIVFGTCFGTFCGQTMAADGGLLPDCESISSL